MRNHVLLSMAVLVAVPSMALASFSGSHLTKIADFVQTSAAVPTGGVYRFHSEYNLSNETDRLTSQGTRPDNTTYAFNDTDPFFSFFDEGGFASPAAMNAFYGSGIYKHTIVTGGLAGSILTIDVPEDRYPDVVPAFSPGTFAALPALIPGQDFNVSANTITPDPLANFALITFLVRDSSGNEVHNDTHFLFGAGVQPPFESTLPGSDILPGETYTFDLRFYNVTLFTDTVNNLETAIEHQYITTAAATAIVPEPAGVLLLAPALLALSRRPRTTL